MTERSEVLSDDQPAYAPPDAPHPETWKPPRFAVASPELRHSSPAGLATFFDPHTAEGAERDAD